MKRSPGCVCITNPLRGRHNQVSVLVVWQSEGPHSSACSMNSPAPQDTGTQPGHSSTRSWDAARAELYRDLRCRELVGRNTHKGRKKQSGHIQDPAGPSLPCLSGKKKVPEASVASPSLADFQDGHWKKDLGDTAATKDEKRGHVHAHHFLTGMGLK